MIEWIFWVFLCDWIVGFFRGICNGSAILWVSAWFVRIYRKTRENCVWLLWVCSLLVLYWKIWILLFHTVSTLPNRHSYPILSVSDYRWRCFFSLWFYQRPQELGFIRRFGLISSVPVSKVSLSDLSEVWTRLDNVGLSFPDFGISEKSILNGWPSLFLLAILQQNSNSYSNGYII